MVEMWIFLNLDILGLMVGFTDENFGTYRRNFRCQQPLVDIYAKYFDRAIFPQDRQFFVDLSPIEQYFPDISSHVPINRCHIINVDLLFFFPKFPIWAQFQPTLPTHMQLSPRSMQMSQESRCSI